MKIIIGGHWENRPWHFTGTNIQYNDRFYCFHLEDEKTLCKNYLDEKLGKDAHKDIFPILKEKFPGVNLI